MTEDEISYMVRGAIFKVYNKLGPGLLETVYEAALRNGAERLREACINTMPTPIRVMEGESMDEAMARVDVAMELWKENCDFKEYLKTNIVCRRLFSCETDRHVFDWARSFIYGAQKQAPHNAESKAPKRRTNSRSIVATPSIRPIS